MYNCIKNKILVKKRKNIRGWWTFVARCAVGINKSRS